MNNLAAPDTLKTLDRTPPAPLTLPSSDGAAKSKTTSALQPGESFSHLLNRQQTQKITADLTASAPRAGEPTRDFLNRQQTPAAIPDETAPQVDETRQNFVNRRHISKAQQLANIDKTTKPDPSVQKPGETHSSFVNRRQTIDAPDAAAVRQEKAEKAAGDLVSNALILPMLKQLRRSPWGENSVFSGGIGEKTFGPEFDIQIADRIAHSPRLGVKTALAGRLMQRNVPTTRADATKPTEVKKLDVHG